METNMSKQPTFRTPQRWKYLARQLRAVQPDPATGITSLTHAAAQCGDELVLEIDRLREVNAELTAALRLVRMTPGFDATATYGQSVIDALAKSGAV